jgi:DNA invertase Pin-like site-specific DNA recombinase
MYLRKSRQDDPNETVEEVLAKHETILQEWAEKELGFKIEEDNIYREVISGESIADREEIKKVLARLEDPAVVGVLCVEPSRLSRGDLADCAKIIDSFRFSKSLIATPYMTYDLENKMERKFFQDELLRSNEFLEYTKSILWRGRVAAIKRGCFINNVPPYGFKKIKIGKDNTLEIVEDKAEVVRLVFDLYVKDGLTPHRIAMQLNEMGIPAP